MRAYEKNYDWQELVADERRLYYETQPLCLKQHIEDSLPNFKIITKVDIPSFDLPTELAPDISTPGTPVPEKMFRWEDTDGPRSQWAKEKFNLISCHTDYHTQPPGGLVFDHADVQGPLSRHWKAKNISANTNNKRHLIIAMNDWAPGQAWMLHRQTYTGWCKGEVMEMPWYMTHATVNANNDTSASRLIVVGITA